MGKKRKHESVEELQILDESELEPGAKKQKHDENGVADKIDVWLIKKPKNISIEHLNSIRIPKKFKNDNRHRTFETEGGSLDCTFERPSKSMVYFQTPEVLQNVKDGLNLPILQSVRGVASLKPNFSIEDPFPDEYDENLFVF